MIRMLGLGRAHGYHRLRTAVEQALDLNCLDVAAVEHLMGAEQLARPRVAPIDVGHLQAFERPLPVVTEYDQLLRVGGSR
jgi:hypothetical protein